MGKVIILDDYVIDSYGMTFRQHRCQIAYAHFKSRHHRMLQERDEAKKRERASTKKRP